MNAFFFRFQPAWIAALVLLTAVGCGIVREDSVSSECVLAEEQSNTLLGKWALTPIPFAVSSFSFSNQVDFDLASASLKVWRDYSLRKSVGASAVLDYESSPGVVRLSDSSSMAPDSICNYDLLHGDPVNSTSFSGPVVIHKRTNWPDNLSGIIALTTSCPVSDSNKNFKFSYIELNMKDFFSPGKQQVDVQSVLIHEIGHALGLGHSCEFLKSGESSVVGIPDCNAKYLNKSYRSAVMYPTYSNGEVRRTLNGNDIGRLNCLYP